MKTEQEIKEYIVELEKAIPMLQQQAIQTLQQQAIQLQANIHAKMGALEAYKKVLDEEKNAS